MCVVDQYLNKDVILSREIRTKKPEKLLIKTGKKLICKAFCSFRFSFNSLLNILSLNYFLTMLPSFICNARKTFHIRAGLLIKILHSNSCSGKTASIHEVIVVCLYECVITLNEVIRIAGIK